jgi:ribosomal protein L44E
MALPVIGITTFDLKVPSTGKTLEYRPYTVKEEKGLLIANESKDPKAMVKAARNLIRSCVPDIDVDKMTMFDFEYIFLQLRSKSVGENADLRVKCKKCEHQNEVSINVEDVKIKNEVKKNMRVQLSDDGVGIMLNYPSFKMAETLVGKDQGAGANIVDMIVACTESIYDKDQVYPAAEQSHKELVAFVESIPSSKFKEIGTLFESMPTVALNLDFKCMACGEQNHLEVEGLSNFF